VARRFLLWLILVEVIQAGITLAKFLQRKVKLNIGNVTIVVKTMMLAFLKAKREVKGIIEGIIEKGGE